MKPKLLLLAHNSHIPLAKRRLLEKEFILGSHAADWQYGLISAAWKLRGWDVISCQTVYHAFLASMWVPDTPLIVENHGDLDERNQTIAKWMVRRAWALRSVSKWTASQYDKFFKPEGGWVYHKSFPAWTDEDLFWEACRIYKKTSLFHVLYAGGRDDHKGFKMAQKLGYVFPTSIVEGLTQIELARAMARAHVVILPSLREGLGLVALEAMMTGTPVIVSNVGGLKEIVTPGVTGLRVEPEDYDGWVKAIKALEVDRMLREVLIGNAMEFVETYWTKERFLNGYKKLVEESLQST